MRTRLGLGALLSCLAGTTAAHAEDPHAATPALAEAPARPSADDPRAVAQPGFTLDAEARGSVYLNPDYPADWLLGIVGTFGYDLRTWKPGLRLSVGSAFCDPEAACQDRSMVMAAGPAISVPIVAGPSVRFELDAAYRFGTGAAAKWWHGAEGGIFLGFVADKTPWSAYPPWWGFKLTFEQVFVGKPAELEDSALLGLSLVYRVQ